MSSHGIHVGQAIIWQMAVCRRLHGVICQWAMTRQNFHLVSQTHLVIMRKVLRCVDMLVMDCLCQFGKFNILSQLRIKIQHRRQRMLSGLHIARINGGKQDMKPLGTVKSRRYKCTASARTLVTRCIAFDS